MDVRYECRCRSHSFLAEIISHVVWLYYLFSRSLRDVELIWPSAGWWSLANAFGIGAASSAPRLPSDYGVGGHDPVSYQVQEQIDGWISNRANAFVDCVKDAKLFDATKKQLYTINWRQLWFSRIGIDGFDPIARALATLIMRCCMG